jgi:branched-chain amino acid transport system substrate-binding protein
VKRIIAVLLVVVFITAGLGGVAYADEEPANEVYANFGNYWVYDVPGDTFTDGEVTGTENWHVDLNNKVDETGASVAAVAMSLASELEFDISDPALVTMGPPLYEWFFGDVLEGSEAYAIVGIGMPGVFPVTFTPGFDASRTVDETYFTGPGVQTLTITLTPRETTERFLVYISALEDNLVNPVIISHTGGGEIHFDPDGHWLEIHPTGLELDTTYTYCITIEVTPKVAEVEFMPMVYLQWDEGQTSGTTVGSSGTYPVDGVGTWTLSAEGSYEWLWGEYLVKGVSFEAYSEVPKESIVFGASRPLTGPNAAIGYAGLDTIMQMWQEEVNADGGIYVAEYGKKLPVEFIIYDDGSDIATMEALTEKLIVEDQVDILLSACGTALLEAQAPIANDYGYVLITAEGAGVNLRDMLPGLPYVFVTLPFSAHYQLPVFADMLAAEGAETAYIVSIDDAHGEEYYNVAATEFARVGIDILADVRVPITETDFNSIVQAAKAADPDVFCCFAYPPIILPITSVASALCFNPDAFLVGPGGNFGFYVATLGAEAVEGVTCFAAANEETSPELAQLFSDLEAIIGYPNLDYWGQPYYMALLQIWQQAIEATGTLDQDVLRDYIATTTFDTILGPTWFETIGGGGGLLAKECHPGEIGQWQSGVCEIVGGGPWPATVLTGDFVYPKPEWPAQANVWADTSYTYRTACDSVDNITTEQQAGLNSNLHNIGCQAVGSPTLEFNTGETVTYVMTDYLVSGPPPPYRWEFPDIEAGQMSGAYAGITETGVFSTGFSVSRSVDQERFPASGGTQILTISVTMEEARENLDVHGNAAVDGLDIATITAGSGPNINIDPAGQWFHVSIDEPEVGQLYEWQVTIEIGPLPPEFEALEYMPTIWVGETDTIASGTFQGSSLSLNSYAMDGTMVLGTWTWTRPGDYFWNWSESVHKQVELIGYAVNAFVEAPTQEAIQQAIDDGLAWLRSQQHGDGSWYWGNPGEAEYPNVGMTGLAVWSLIHGLVPPSDPAVSAGIEFLLSHQVTDEYSVDCGAIHTGQPTYETAIAILALRATNDPAYLDEMTLAADYLAKCQNDEGVVYPHFPGGIGPDHWAYGGWSYNYGGEEGIPLWPAEPESWDARADISCTQFAMIGLKAAEEAGVVLSHDSWENVWAKAEIYVTRCQNPDGGFVYQPPDSPRGPGGSSGAETAAGVWCFALSGVPVEDSRVQAGLDWLDCNYFYDRNPPYGMQWHYYFLWTAAKAFTHYGRPPLLEEGNWYYDYAGYLLANQEADGHWHNPQYLVDMDDRESHLHRTEEALLILERAVMPPPPGIDLIGIDHMFIDFGNLPGWDTIAAQAAFSLQEWASYDLSIDDVTVNIDGFDLVIPAGSFRKMWRKEVYTYNSPWGVWPKVSMVLNFDQGSWNLCLYGVDASVVDNCDGVDVTFTIGAMRDSEHIDMKVKRLSYWADY